MAAKKKLRMRGIKRTPKRLEDDLIDKSKKLAENPELIRPKCNGKCLFCTFKKTFAAIDRLGSVKNDSEALVKLASKGGDDLFKAYCGTISLAAAGSIPYLATGKLAGGESVSYAQRGNAPNRKLIGCQYYDDPKIRLLLYGDIANKKRLHIYSYDNEIVCSKSPGMPEDYFYDAFWDSPYEFPDDEIQCGHDAVGVLVIKSKSANKEIRICKDCAKDVSTLQYVISRIACKDPLDDFEVYVEHKYHAEGTGKNIIDEETLKKYANGNITDVSIINSVLRNEMGSLKNNEKATYIIGNKNYGSDLDAFLSNLNGSDVEKNALKSYLSKNNVSVITRTERTSDALNAVWADARNVILSFTDEETADSIEDYSKLNPASTVKIAYQRFVSRDIVAKLPVFNRPGPVTKYADAYAKAVKVGGAEMLAEVFNNFTPKAGKNRAMAKAFCDVAGCDVIKCAGDEVEFAEFLLPFVKQLIESEGEQYREKMNTLLTAMGCGETV